MVKRHIESIVFLADNSGVGAVFGVAYNEINVRLRSTVDLSKFFVKNVRVIVGAVGDEAGAGKGIEIYNFTDAALLCEVTWAGNGIQQGLAGAWTACILDKEVVLCIMAKGSSVTETVTAYRIELQIEYG